MASLYLIRHGQASFGAENYDSLSDLGVDQCRRLGVWWRERGHVPARVLVGPMVRHRQSAEAFAEGYARSLDMTTLGDLAEFDHENVLEVYRPDFADKAAIATSWPVRPVRARLSTRYSPRQSTAGTMVALMVNTMNHGRISADACWRRLTSCGLTVAMPWSLPRAEWSA